MKIRKAEKKDIPRILALLGQVISFWLSPARMLMATPRPSEVSLGAVVTASR